MPRVFQSHHEEEPQRLTAAAARSTEESARLRADLAAAADDLAFEMDTARGGVAVDMAFTVGTHSILASSDHSSGDDAAPASLDADAQRPLRTSVFTKLASQLLNRTSSDSAPSSDGYGSAPSGQFNDSLIRSPEFDKISIDSTPVAPSAVEAAAAASAAPAHPTRMTTTTTTSAYHHTDSSTHSNASATPPRMTMSMFGPSAATHSNNSMDMSAGPSVSMYNGNGNANHTNAASGVRASGRVRVSSDFSSVQREMEHNAFASPVSEATYMNMRKTLDPEALLNGDLRHTANNAVLSSLRPIADPFDLTRDPNLPGPDFQRRRAATTGAVVMASGRSTHGRLTGTAPRGSIRSQRSWTVTGQAPPPAPVILAHDPRGTFRTTTADTAQQIFASQQVRLQNKWSTDVWIYMKNAHPFLGLCTAHRWHPYQKKDRALVLLTSLLLAFFLCGLYATQECCSTVDGSTVAVVSSTTTSASRHLALLHDSTVHRVLAETNVNCQPFGGRCDATKNLCTLGSRCHDGKCVALDRTANATQCSTTTSCPVGWRCASSTQGTCRPSSSLVCYLPTTSNELTARGVSFAAEDEDDETLTDETTSPTTTDETFSPSSGSGGNGAAPVDAISVIAKLIQYSKENNITADGSVLPGTTPAPSSSTPTTPTPTLMATTTTPTTTAPTTIVSNKTVDSDVAVLDPSAINATVETLMITLTKPTDGGVYTVASTIPVAWHVTLLEGERAFVNTLRFRVDFSRDGLAFDTLAADIESDSVLDASPSQYHFDWDLAFNDTRACTSCVLRVCTEQVDATVDPVCIRTDGATTLTSTSTTTSSGMRTAATTNATASTATAPKITFHIVRDVVACACGIKYASFVTYSYLLALVVPVALLVLEHLVTFYQDSKVLGLFARRGGPKMPVVGFYAAEATTRGRIVLILIGVGLVFACGMVAATITSATFLDSTGDVVVLWVLMFLLVLVVGFIYCSALYCIVFTVRWYQDEKTWSQQGFADFAMMFDDPNGTMLQAQPHMPMDMAPPSSQDHDSTRSYQWPFGDVTNSSRSNYSTAVVTQRSGQAIV